MDTGNNTRTCPVKLNKFCLIGLGSRGNKQLAKITDEAQESDCLNPSSHDDLGDNSGKDPGFHGHWSEVRARRSSIGNAFSYED